MHCNYCTAPFKHAAQLASSQNDRMLTSTIPKPTPLPDANFVGLRWCYGQKSAKLLTFATFQRRDNMCSFSSFLTIKWLVTHRTSTYAQQEYGHGERFMQFLRLQKWRRAGQISLRSVDQVLHFIPMTCIALIYCRSENKTTRTLCINLVPVPKYYRLVPSLFMKVCLLKSYICNKHKQSHWCIIVTSWSFRSQWSGF